MASKFMTSYMPSDGATVIRNADVLPFPFTARPQAMAVYVRFIELEKTDFVDTHRILQIGDTPSAANRFILFRNGGTANYRALHGNSSTSVTADLALGSVGAVIELVAQLSATGTVKLIGSADSAAPTESSESSALILPPAWEGKFVFVGGIGGASGTTGSQRFQNVYVHRGVQSIETMRRGAGV